VLVRRDLKYGAAWIKLMASGLVDDVLSDYNMEELSDAQMAKAVEVAHRTRRHGLAHAEGTAGIEPTASVIADS
jgi:imidazolonepropionase-like amidohydrolase